MIKVENLEHWEWRKSKRKGKQMGKYNRLFFSSWDKKKLFDS